MGYSATAWWCIVAINLGRWSFFIINVQPECRNLLVCLGRKCRTFSLLWSAELNWGFFCLFVFLLFTDSRQHFSTFWDQYCYAFFSPYLSDLHHPLPCPASFPISQALLLLSLILWLLQHLLFVSVFSSFSSLFHRGTNIFSEDCETENAPWHSWKPHDFGLSGYWPSLRLCVNELFLQRPILKSPAGTQKEWGRLRKNHCQATQLSIMLRGWLHVLKLSILLCCRCKNTAGCSSESKSFMSVRQKCKCRVVVCKVAVKSTPTYSSPMAIFYDFPQDAGFKSRLFKDLRIWDI